MDQQRRLSYLLLLNIGMITALVTVGLTAHSLGVLAAGGDFIADSLGILLGLTAIQLRDKHGKHQAPTYVALVNGLLLLGVMVFVLAEALWRLLTQSPEVHGLPILIVSGISMLVMAAGVVILGKGADNEDLHMRSVLLDTISDGLAAAGVAIVGGVIYVTNGLYWLDSVTALIIGVIVGYGAVKLLKDVSVSLRQGTPIEIDND